MTADKIKRLLDTFVEESERDFTVEILRRKTRRRVGSYKPRDRRILLYPNCAYANTRYWAIVGVALHELAHHLVYKRHGPGYHTHGEEYWTLHNDLLAEFNCRYAELLKGRVVCDRNPRKVPKFIKFTNSSAEPIMAGGKLS